MLMRQKKQQIGVICESRKPLELPPFYGLRHKKSQEIAYGTEGEKTNCELEVECKF